jgi:hypothetical protein
MVPASLGRLRVLNQSDASPCPRVMWFQGGTQSLDLGCGSY